MTLREWADEMKAKTGTCQVQPNHLPTPGELNNLCYLSMKYIMGWQMRHADFAAIQITGGIPTSMEELDKEYIPAIAEYMWDHLMGEPETPTTEDLEYAIRAIRDQLFTMDEKTRNDIGNTEAPK